jgi:hypothetical protein
MYKLQHKIRKEIKEYFTHTEPEFFYKEAEIFQVSNIYRGRRLECFCVFGQRLGQKCTTGEDDICIPISEEEFLEIKAIYL